MRISVDNQTNPFAGKVITQGIRKPPYLFQVAASRCQDGRSNIAFSGNTPSQNWVGQFGGRVVIEDGQEIPVAMSSRRTSRPAVPLARLPNSQISEGRNLSRTIDTRTPISSGTAMAGRAFCAIVMPASVSAEKHRQYTHLPRNWESDVCPAIPLPPWQPSAVGVTP